MKIYTKKGDDGSTGLLADYRVSKDSSRIAAYGSVVELNAHLGVVLADRSTVEEDFPWRNVVTEAQGDLFCIGSELASPDPEASQMRLLTRERIEQLEQAIDQLDAMLPKQTSFILPGGCSGAAHLHVARTVCRRAERDTIRLMNEESDCDFAVVIMYLNRLSDLLFILARYLNQVHGVGDTAWQRP